MQTSIRSRFNEISGVVTEFQNAVACAQRIFDLIEEEPQTPESENAVELKDISGNVRAEHVDFSYVDGQKLIRDFNLAVKPGQRIAIVGPTGCGKTTIINLLMRFYDVNRGSISVEGIDIREMTRKSLRAGYGMVLQDTWLKTGTIRDNITMGRRMPRKKRLSRRQKPPTFTVLSDVCRRGMIHGSRKTGAVSLRGRNSFSVLPESCCAGHRC